MHHTHRHLGERSLTDRKHRKLQDSELLMLYPTKSHLSLSDSPKHSFPARGALWRPFKLQSSQREALPETGWQGDQLDNALTLYTSDPGFVDATNFLCPAKHDHMSCSLHMTLAYCNTTLKEALCCMCPTVRTVCQPERQDFRTSYSLCLHPAARQLKHPVTGHGFPFRSMAGELI